jgi:hypothetical protein
VRQLEVVAVSDDGTYVLLASDENAARATHAVRIDNRLHAALRGDLEDDSDDRRESELSPRDIQARLRAGETPEAVAQAAKVSLPRVMRYAGPVISERERIVGQARAAVLQRSRGPELTTPMGDMVEKSLAETAGLKLETVQWDAKRRDDGSWVIELTYTARGGARTASWLWQPAERELASLNSLATRLGAEASTPVRRTAQRRLAPRATARRTTARKPARKSAAKKTAARKPVAKKAAAKKAVPKRAAPKRTGAKVTAKRPATKRPVAKKAVARKAVVKKTVAKKTAPKRRTPRSERPLIEPSVKRVNGRVEVPSWSDVLLGVQAPAASRGRRRS